MPASLSFRTMQEADLDAIVQIEQAAYSHPWTKGMFADSLISRYECWVIEQANHVIGHGVLSIACGEAHVLNVCVTPEKQRQGVGRAVMEHFLAQAKKQQVEMVFLEVRMSNSAAQELYLSLGFNQIGERRNYYPAENEREDALIFALQLLYE